MTTPPAEGHVVEQFKIGNTRVKICDDYCRDKTQEEVQQVLDRIAKNALRSIRAANSNT